MVLGAGLLLGLVSGLGCRTAKQPQLWIESALSEVRWYDNGFLLKGSGRKFRYVREKQNEKGELTVWSDQRQEVTYIDVGMDDTVDEIETRDGTSLRGGPGSEELFDYADKLLARHKEELRIASYVKRWQAAGPDGYVVLRGIGSY